MFFFQVMLDTVGPELQVVNRSEHSISLESGAFVVLTPDQTKDASSELLPINFGGLSNVSRSICYLSISLLFSSIPMSLTYESCIYNLEKSLHFHLEIFVCFRIWDFHFLIYLQHFYIINCCVCVFIFCFPVKLDILQFIFHIFMRILGVKTFTLIPIQDKLLYNIMQCKMKYVK